MVFLAVPLFLLALWPVQSVADEAEDKGRYLFQLANCYACHTDTENDGAALAGGRALETEFGTFFSPNITPDRETGIGGWSDTQFIEALRKGLAPDGSHYFPAFPYPAYSGMKEGDILAIKAYLFEQPAVQQKNKTHQLNWYLQRWMMPLWNWLNAKSTEDNKQDDSRGAYLVNTLGHCNECHTPRDSLGMLDWQRHLAGNEQLQAPDISASALTDWDDDALIELFQDGVLLDGDYVSDHMAEVVEYSSSQWTDDDLSAVIAYLRNNR